MRPVAISIKNSCAEGLNENRVAHASELPLLFGPVPAVEEDFANKMLDFYINFITDLDPGGKQIILSSEKKKLW